MRQVFFFTVPKEPIGPKIQVEVYSGYTVKTETIETAFFQTSASCLVKRNLLWI